MTDIKTVPHAFMRPFIDVGDGKLRTDSRKFHPVMWGSDPHAMEFPRIGATQTHEGGKRFRILKTYGPTLPPFPSGARRGSPGIYAFSNDELVLGGDGEAPWSFDGVVLRPWGSMPRPPGFSDTEGIETMTVAHVGPYLLGMYHGYDNIRRRPRTVNDLYIAVALASDPLNWQKVKRVLREEDILKADPRLVQVTNLSEASLQWDPLALGGQGAIIGTISVQGYHDRATPPSETNPAGGSAGTAWRTHMISSQDAVNWAISEPIIIPPDSFEQARRGRAVNMASHSAFVLDPREPRIAHIFVAWAGNVSESSGYEHLPIGLRHWAALLDEPPLTFHPNPYGTPGPDGQPTNCVRPRNFDPLQEDSGHVGGPAPLLLYADGLTDHLPEWWMIYHADNKWRKENGTQEEKDAVEALETRGRRHTRLAREGS